MNKKEMKKLIRIEFMVNDQIEKVDFIGSIEGEYFNYLESDVDIIVYLKNYDYVFSKNILFFVKRIKENFEKMDICLGVTIFSKKLRSLNFYNIKLLNNFLDNISSKNKVDFRMIILAENYYLLCKLIFNNEIYICRRRVLKCFLHIFEICSKILGEKKDSLKKSILFKLKNKSEFREVEFENYFDQITNMLLLVLKRGGINENFNGMQHKATV